MNFKPFRFAHDGLAAAYFLSKSYRMSPTRRTPLRLILSVASRFDAFWSFLPFAWLLRTSAASRYAVSRQNGVLLEMCKRSLQIMADSTMIRLRFEETGSNTTPLPMMIPPGSLEYFQTDGTDTQHFTALSNSSVYRHSVHHPETMLRYRISGEFISTFCCGFVAPL